MVAARTESNETTPDGLQPRVSLAHAAPRGRHLDRLVQRVQAILLGQHASGVLGLREWRQLLPGQLEDLRSRPRDEAIQAGRADAASRRERLSHGQHCLAEARDSPSADSRSADFPSADFPSADSPSRLVPLKPCPPNGRRAASVLARSRAPEGQLDVLDEPSRRERRPCVLRARPRRRRSRMCPQTRRCSTYAACCASVNRETRNRLSGARARGPSCSAVCHRRAAARRCGPSTTLRPSCCRPCTRGSPSSRRSRCRSTGSRRR